MLQLVFLAVQRGMVLLGSLERSQEARVALAIASSISYASFVLCKLPRDSMVNANA